MYVCAPCESPVPEEARRSSRTGVTDARETTFLWKMNLGPLEEPSVLLTTEPSLQAFLNFLRLT